jgi:hypothetical protein
MSWRSIRSLIAERRFVEFGLQFRTVNFSERPLTSADEFANLGNGHDVVVDNGCDAVDYLGPLRQRFANKGERPPDENCGANPGSGIVSILVRTSRKLESGSDPVKRGNLPSFCKSCWRWVSINLRSRTSTMVILRRAASIRIVAAKSAFSA